MSELANVLTAFARSKPRDSAALDVMQLSMLDWAAVALAGQSEPVAKILRAQALEEGGTAEATLVGHPDRVPARMAATVNGTTSHALDYDDTHFAHIGHPSVAVIPAALALAERMEASGVALREAALIGCEASIRIGLWLGRTHYQNGFHQTATAGAFGAALAAARLLNLTDTQLHAALGLVSTRASGLKSQFGTMGKPWNAGLAAANGVEAALLASKGMVSNPGGLDGAQGFGATHHGQGDLTAFDGIGDKWYFSTVQHKFHACCHGLHATLEALSEVTDTVDHIETIEIYTHPRWMSVCNIPHPLTGLEAKFSYAQVTAMRLLGHDTARLESFDDDLVKDPALSALRNKVSVIADDGLTEMQARVQVTKTCGTSYVVAHDLDTALPLATRAARIKAKAAALIGQTRARHLWSLIETQASARDFAHALSDNNQP